MAEILEVKTVVDATAGLNSIEKLVSKMDEFIDTQKEATANQKASGRAGKAAGEMTAKSIGKASTSFRAMGIAIKGAGIGLLVGVIALLVEAFKNNQKVMDVFTNVLGTIGAVGTQVANIVGDVVGKVSDATRGFDKLTKVAKGLLTIALTPIKTAFYTLSLGLQEAQLAWEQSFLGDKDPETIKELNAAIAETSKNIYEVAVDAVDAGKSVITNFAGAISEIGQVAEGVVKGVKQISIEATYEAVKANTQLQKSAELAEAGIRGLIEKYDLQAEKLRQIRDDDKKTFKERIKANEDLGEVLKEQQKEQLKLAQISIDAANSQLKLDKNSQEAKVALKVAENEYAATLAQVAGFEAEQLTNKNSLLREQKQVIEELALLGKDEFERRTLEAEQEKIRREEQATLAITDAQALADALLAIDTEYNNQIKKIDDDRLKAKTAITEAEKAMVLGQVQAVGTAIGQIGALFEKGTAASKAAAIAEIAIGTGVGFINALDIAQKTSKATGPAAAIAFPVFYATQLAAVLGAASKAKSILSTAKGGGGSGSTPSAPSIGGARPSTEIPRIPNFNATNEGVGGRSGFGSVRAVVVQQDIKDSASLDNRVDDLVKIGK